MSVLTVAHLFSSCFGFIAMWLVATHYGDANLGRYLNVFAWLSQAILITRLGTDQYAVRQVAAGNDSPSSLAATVIRLRLVSACAAAALLFALPFFFERLADDRLLLGILGLCILPTIIRIEWICQALHHTNVYGVFQLSMQMLNASFVGLAVVFSLDLWAVAGARSLSETLVSLTLFWWITKHFARIDFKAPAQSIRDMARASSPIAGSLLLRGLCLESDILILGIMLPDADVGHYGPGFRIFLFLVALNSAYSMIMFPRISSHANSKQGAMAQEVRRSLRIGLPLALLGAGVMAAIAQPVITGVFGAEFEPGVNSLRILCVALVFNLANRHLRLVLIASSKQSTDLRSTAVGTAAHLLSKVAFISAFGIVGAAMGFVTGELVLLVVLAIKTRPLLKLQA